MTEKQWLRFWTKVEFSDECWVWRGANAQGYGQIYWGGRVVGAHRISYADFMGEIPPGMHLDHLCRNPICVRPDHLEAVTPKENYLRGFGIPARNARKTHCKRGHEFTVENTRITKKGRECRPCAAFHERRRHARLKLAAMAKETA